MQTKTKVYDIAIVGCGISGSYCAYRLRQFYPNKSILLIEKNPEPGGRLKSLDINIQNGIAIEYGGMRFFPSVHMYADKLSKILQLETIPISYIEDNNLAYLRGTHRLIKQLSNQNSYNIEPDESGVDPTIYINELILNELLFLGIDINSLFDNQKISESNFWQFIKSRASNEMIQFYNDSSGYHFTIDNIHTGVGMLENLALDKSLNDGTQIFVKGGMQKFVFTMLNNTQNVNLLLNTKLLGFEYNKNIVLKLKSNNKFELRTKKLILTMPLTNLKNLPLKIFDQNVLMSWSALKIFIIFKESWWERLGLKSGRSVTDLPLRQVWYYSPRVLMIYCDNIYTHYWINYMKAFGKKIKFQNWIDVSKVNPDLIESITSQLSEMHQYNVTSQMIKSISWAYWKNGAYWWKPCDVDNIRKNITNPYKNIFITNSCWSHWQGWINGAIENADELLRTHFGIPSIIK